MIDSFDMLIRLFERAALLLILLFLLTRIPRFKETLQRDKHSSLELIIITIIFSAFAIFSTYSGIDVEGSLVNVRIVTIMASGILFGPKVGITTGIVSGLHRYLIDIGGITALACLITSVIAGFISGLINKKVKKSLRWIYGIAAGMLSEILTMLLILIMANPSEAGIEIVSQIAFPMIAGEINIGLIVLLIMSVEGEKEKVAAQQAKLSLDIANKTLPYFRSVNNDSLNKICKIIKEEIKADAVGMTDKECILAYAGYGKDEYRNGQRIQNNITKAAINSGEITSINNIQDHQLPGIQHLLVIPLKEKEEVTGALEIYYRKESKLTYPLQTMAIGLAQIISTQMEVSRIEQIKEAANKAELQALQSKINPHFLFNALNTIASLTRRNPKEARKLIINLSSYMRYNIEIGDELIDIHQALKQVEDYVEIEIARFGNRLQVVYDIDDVQVKIPSLLIQPLVENAIKHGILKTKEQGTVTIAVKRHDHKIRISVMDTGAGINDTIIQKLYNEKMPINKIGLQNVHQRIKHTYGTGLLFRQLSPGTEVYFDVEEEKV